MAIIPLQCPHCHGKDLAKFGKTPTGKQRYACNNPECPYRTFTLEPHAYRGRRPEVKEKIVEMAINGSGVRDTARVLGVSTKTVVEELKKKEKNLENVNHKALEKINKKKAVVEVKKVALDEENNESKNSPQRKAEVDEMQSFVKRKSNQRWLWHGIDHNSGEILAYVLGTRQDQVFIKLKKLLKPFGISRFYTDGLKTYERKLPPQKRQISKYKMHWY